MAARIAEQNREVALLFFFHWITSYYNLLWLAARFSAGLLSIININKLAKTNLFAKK